jgi:hypothetical protein
MALRSPSSKRLAMVCPPRVRCGSSKPSMQVMFFAVHARHLATRLSDGARYPNQPQARRTAPSWPVATQETS